MNMRRARGLFGPLVIGLLLASLSPAPSLGSHEAETGPPYVNNENIAVAQRILVSENLLKSGGFTQGKLDQGTIQALLAFQRSHGIEPSGVLDPETLGMLTSHEQRIVVAREPGQPIQVARQVEPMRKFEPAAQPQAEPVTERTMPKTASPLPLLAAIGALLIAGGATLLRRRA